MKRHSHIFFDLDHTLWDFDRNAGEALEELYEKHSLNMLGVPDVNSFAEAYREINTRMWTAYHKGELDKATLRTERFSEALRRFQVAEEHIPQTMWSDFLQICPLKTHLFPHAIETLEYLSGNYRMSIITNGFNEVQHLKMKHSKLDKYFDRVITSEHLGFQKPDARIFRHTLEQAGVKAEETAMIGDSLEADIAGALGAGLTAVWFNPAGQVTAHQAHHEISSLQDLCNLF